MGPGVEAKSCSFPADGFDLADQALRFQLMDAIGEEDIDAALGEIDGGVAAEATAATGDNSDFIGHHAAPVLRCALVMVC